MKSEDTESDAAISSKDKFQDFPTIPYRIVLKQVPSGEIAIERGSDGQYLRFDCDCIHALPYCQAQCCALIGTVIYEHEIEANPHLPYELDKERECYVLERGSDGFCRCLDRRTRLCTVYEDRPETCKQFHCTKGASQRGWKLSNKVHRQSEG
jgi:Fe-S-cluster containining protein